MATYRKRGGKWRVEVRCCGVYESRTFMTKTHAKMWAEDFEESLRTGNYRDSNHTLGDALDKYAKEVTPKHKGARWERLRIILIKRYEVASEPLKDLTAAHIAGYRDTRLREVSPASVNRELNVLSAVINTARIEWGWISTNPVSGIRRPKNPPPRHRRISDNEIKQICAELNNNDVRDMFLLALESAMRLGEMCGIKSDDIHGRWVTLNDTKNTTTRHVPLSPRAKELIREFEVGPGNASRLFADVVKRLGIDDLKFHDSRHEAVFRLAQKIKNPMDLAKITGHKDLKILLNTYYSPTPDDLASLLE